jgi:hypothetical protein
MRRLAIWIEPVLISEWVEQMRRFGRSTGHEIDGDEARRRLRWIDPERDTQTVRRLCENIQVKGRPIFCIWTDRKINFSELQVDHCFPFSAWPCDDLWNLFPTSRQANAAKRDRLVSAELLERRRDRIVEWWHEAFLLSDDAMMRRRFRIEARTSLPLGEADEDAELDPTHVLEGMGLVRLRLARDQQIPEWNG